MAGNLHLLNGGKQIVAFIPCMRVGTRRRVNGDPDGCHAIHMPSRRVSQPSMATFVPPFEALGLKTEFTFSCVARLQFVVGRGVSLLLPPQAIGLTEFCTPSALPSHPGGNNMADWTTRDKVTRISKWISRAPLRKLFHVPWPCLQKSGTDSLDVYVGAVNPPPKPINSQKSSFLSYTNN